MKGIQKELKAKVAQLESKVDHLETELAYLNLLLIRCGFENGIEDLKQTIYEVMQMERFSHPDK